MAMRDRPAIAAYNGIVTNDDYEELVFGGDVRGATMVGRQGPNGDPGTGSGHDPGTGPEHDPDRTDPAAGRGRKPRRIWLRVLITLLVVALVAGGGVGGWWLWNGNWRTTPVSFNGTAVEVRMDQPLADVIESHGWFGAEPGRLMSITGKVVDERGGKPVAIALDGRATGIETLRHTTIRDVIERDSGTDTGLVSSLGQILGRGRHDVVTHRISLSAGADVTEGHTVKTTAIKHGSAGADITGGIIQLRWPGRDGRKEVWVGKESGETVDKGVVEKPQDSRITALTPRPPSDRKVIALTFDDGPSQYTPRMLDILKEKGVHATFFDVGTQSQELGDVERRIVAEGHQLASHSDTHPNMPTMSTKALRADLEAGFRKLAKGKDGKTSHMFRSPYGAFTVKDWQRAGDLISTNVLWDIDTLDWKRPGADAIADAVLGHAHNGAIALMHTGGGDRSQTLAALPVIIDGLKARGYEFVTVGELMALDQDHRFPDWAVNGELPAE